MQNKPLPRVTTKITKKQLEEFPKLGRGVDFRRKFSIFKQFGCFGTNDNAQKDVNARLYDKPSEHFENIIRGRAKFIQEELDFFRQCLAYISNKDCADLISDSELRSDKLDVLFSKLFQHKVVLEWDGIDPVHALMGLVIPRHELYLTIKEPKTRWVKLDSTPTIEETVDDDIVLEPGYKFFLNIQENQISFKIHGKPIVIELGYFPSRDEDGRSFRGQSLSTVRKMPYLSDEGDGETDENYWQCSLKGNKPFYIQGDKGRFLFLVIGNAGADISPLLPDGTDPSRITDNDLKFMFEKLALNASLINDIAYGMLNYRV